MIKNTTDLELEILLVATELFFIYDNEERLMDVDPDDLYSPWQFIANNVTEVEYIDALTRLSGCYRHLPDEQ